LIYDRKDDLRTPHATGYHHAEIDIGPLARSFGPNLWFVSALSGRKLVTRAVCLQFEDALAGDISNQTRIHGESALDPSDHFQTMRLTISEHAVEGCRACYRLRLPVFSNKCSRFLSGQNAQQCRDSCLE